MARLTGPSGSMLELRLLSYEFPHLDDKWDANWLIIQMTVVDGSRQWSATEPALLTWEVSRLVKWLRQLADAEPDAKSGFHATEHNLSFRAEGYGDEIRLRAHLSHEFHPEYRSWRASGRRYDLRECSVAFEPGATALLRFADELEQE